MENREPLCPLLRAWKVQPQADACFAQAVWKRIQAGTPAASGGDESRIISFWRTLPLSWAAAAVVAFGSITAGTAAYAYTEIKHGDRHVIAYVKSIDPLLRTDSHSGSHTTP